MRTTSTGILEKCIMEHTSSNITLGPRSGKLKHEGKKVLGG